MRLWLIYQNQNSGYDTYDSAIVAAETEQQARETHPSEYGQWGSSWDSWASKPEHVGVRLIGEAIDNTKAGVICASFNAG